MESTFLKKMLITGLCFFVCTLSTAIAGSTVDNPAVIGPIEVNASPGDPSHDYVYFTPKEDLSSYGYVEEEFFIEGVANVYDTTTDPNAEATIISSGHAYKTRIVVRRPSSKKKFNGVVVLEWQNVTAGYELDAHWAPSWEHFMKKGYAWVGVSAQLVGIHGFQDGRPQNGLIQWGPERYGALDVTDGGAVINDALCYDIYSQAAQAVKAPDGIDPMGGLNVEMVIAAGASQSAARLSVYHNTVHPIHEVVDGFYLLVGGYGLRTDLDVKVFRYLSETDVVWRGPSIRMPDSDTFRSWEVAGTGHSSYVSSVYRDPLVIRDFGEQQWPPDCFYPPYSRARGQFVIDIQYDHLVSWIKYDIAPPTAPVIEFSDDGTMIRDELGIALGGIRLPDVEVPIAMNTGINAGATFCFLYGTYLPFEKSLLDELYPTHGDYVSAVAKCAKKNKKAGYILHKAAIQFIIEAAQSNIGGKK